MPPSWKGFLKLSLVSCPVQLYPATTRANRVAFHNLDRETQHRVQMRAHDAETGEEVARDRLARGYEYETGRYLLVEESELDALEVESSHTIELETFVEPGEIDAAYYDTPYFLAPDGPVADETFRVIQAAMRSKDRAGIGRVVLASRERMVAVEIRDKGLLMTTLRTADEVRAAAPYFADIEKAPAEPEMVAMAAQIIERKSVPFDPQRFDDRYQTALAGLVEAKLHGEKPPVTDAAEPAPVIDLMAALKRSLQAGAESAPRPRSAKKKPAAAKAEAPDPKTRRRTAPRKPDAGKRGKQGAGTGTRRRRA